MALVVFGCASTWALGAAVLLLPVEPEISANSAKEVSEKVEAIDASDNTALASARIVVSPSLNICTSPPAQPSCQPDRPVSRSSNPSCNCLTIAFVCGALTMAEVHVT